MFLKKWWAERKATVRERAFRKWYDWVKDAVASGEPIDELESFVEMGEMFDGPNPFDSGARKAIQEVCKWQKED